MKKKIALIGGARPNFMKIAPLCRKLERRNIPYFIVNTGQHFDSNMAGDFFKEFEIFPNYELHPSRNSVIKQVSDIICGLEKIFISEKPYMVVVVGDVNSTLAAALVANKMNIKLAHVEAGLRSHNKQMPEEFNRVMVDHISDILFVTSEGGVLNLEEEGITENVFFVGNIMIDTIKMFVKNIDLSKETFYFCTLHRAENIDNKRDFQNILNALEVISKDEKIYLSLHPRTKKMAEKFGLSRRLNQIFSILPPLSYKESLFYQKNAKLVLTDSGGIQEETSFLGVPCITLRIETERPVTVEEGTNTVGGVSRDSILKSYRNKKLVRKKTNITKWDGKAAKRIIDIILKS
ncbi:MAG: UDP-N-acetylglucosamine 2-epimerase [Candidatus Zambryskibacteria bacterium RIFCSPHIGHO2_01_FULL_46_30]|uniref:UDP-N-acetylglucosamine 2-epimerase n=1 Tax=Candidatus Zambryskibacteria bacterium RIFCSPHIGHO2_01_FULL_46_30 TaxID=1802739 RepID=A0A1G2T1D1_9BACT|nr:MAG: UDP-N-acetylglucosamine 2-epimerase [Candidatus Zambryskibacteria bacterium RIFCSPHIGHO2_01_FULL_46_30]OHB06085.1 MAG: UDP-N-acetylglucosamine 2-epimerase [Candidatus Zambryskibacteria bacterium RIFCSPLOWO2_01_FULL_47_33]